jgi:hypothetical protein
MRGKARTGVTLTNQRSCKERMDPCRWERTTPLPPFPASINKLLEKSLGERASRVGGTHHLDGLLDLVPLLGQQEPREPAPQRVGPSARGEGASMTIRLMCLEL